MNRVCVVPVWLQEFLVARNYPMNKLCESGWLASILSGDDVKSYDMAQLAMGLRSTVNIVEPLFRDKYVYTNADAFRYNCPEFLLGLDRNDPNKEALVFYRALVCGVSYDSAATTKEQAQLLDFDFEYDGTTLYVIAKRASSSILEPTVRAAILERCMSVMRTYMTIEQVAANELFSRWLRETQRAQGFA